MLSGFWWRRERVFWPVKFTHDASGEVLLSEQGRVWSRWFEAVEVCRFMPLTVWYKPVYASPLVWHCRYVHHNPNDGNDVAHYAKSPVGQFEVYECADGYLMSCPRKVKRPAELFGSLAAAKAAAQSVWSDHADKL